MQTTVELNFDKASYLIYVLTSEELDFLELIGNFFSLDNTTVSKNATLEALGYVDHIHHPNDSSRGLPQNRADELKLMIALKHIHPEANLSSGKPFNFDTPYFLGLNLEAEEISALREIDALLLGERKKPVDLLPYFDLVRKLFRRSNEQKNEILLTLIYHHHGDFVVLLRLFYLKLD